MGCASVKLDSKQNKELSKQLQHSTKVGQILNNMRKKPYQYIKLLEADIKRFKKGNYISYQYGCNQIEYQTVEGPKAWQQTIKFLRAQYIASNQLIRNSVLCQVAARRAPLYKKSKQLKSRSSRLVIKTQKNMESEIKMITGAKPKQGDYAVLVGMDFKLKDRNYIENALVGMIVDDGNPKKDNRKLIFNDNFKHYGSYTMVTDEYVVVVVCLSSENLSSSL